MPFFMQFVYKLKASFWSSDLGNFQTIDHNCATHL
jgi:hypothetical protein